MVWIVIVGLIILAVCGINVYRDQRETQKQQKVMERLRASSMYDGVYHLLTSVKQEYIERITIRSEQVEIYLLNGSCKSFVFQDHRIDPLQPGPLLALAQAVAVDVPLLRDSNYYAFSSSSRKEANLWYEYTMKHSRKDYMLRALRDQNIL